MPTILYILPFLLVYTILVIYAERKVAAFIQDRYGPMEVGYHGLLQTIADLLKLLQKEDIVPALSEKWLFRLAPLLIFAIVFAGFSLVPISPALTGASLSTGVLMLLAIVSLDVIAIWIAGWTSNNKYSTLGTFRAVAQLISYEVPLGLSVICVVVIVQSLDLQEISFQQGILAPDGTHNYFLGVHVWGIETTTIGGFLTWNIFRMPLLFPAWIVFFIATLAESNRAPFDLPEAESELVAGFHTEYSGFRWALLMLAEYSMMLLVSTVGVILFWGSWNTPLPNLGTLRLADWTTGPWWGAGWLLIKVVATVALQIWVRWTYPRLRVDQLMNLSWKFLTPAALALIIGIGSWKIYIS